MTNYFIPLILYFFCIYALKKIIPLLQKNSLIDRPSMRGNHNSDTPKGAGIVIIPIILMSIILILSIHGSINLKWISFLTCTLILCIISLIDDIKSLPIIFRLLAQGLCVLFCIFFFKEDLINILISSQIQIISEENIYILFYISAFFLTLFWLWIINLFNFMDGMDGITSFQMIFFAFVLNILSLFNLMHSDYQFISLIILSVFLAFYRFNKYPAKLFLGDCGSIPAGFIVGFILIDSLISNTEFLPLLIILFYYITDTSLTLIIRFLKKKNIFEAHSDHFYQKFIRSGKTHSEVLKKIILLCILLTFLSFSSIKFPISSLIFGLLSTLMLLIYFKQKFRL